MIPSIYDTGHSPCEHYARVGYDHLAAQITEADYHRPPDPWPEDDVEDDHPGAQARWADRRVLAALIGATPPPKKKPKKEAAPEKPVELAGLRVYWHTALPELKIWAGNATLETLVSGRVAALHAAGPIPEGVRLLDWRLPYPTTSGLDARTAAGNLDIGFSPSRLGMPIITYAAAELLMVVGLQFAPVTRLGRGHYGYTDPDGRWWEYRVVEREGYHRMLTMSQLVCGQRPSYATA